MAQLTPERIVSDGTAYVDYLGEVASPPFAITGYCLGGRIGWRIAATNPQRIAALAAFHAGGLVSDDEDSPHLSAGAISAEPLLRPRRQRPEHDPRTRRDTRASPRSGRGTIPLRALRGSRPRLHDERHCRLPMRPKDLPQILDRVLLNGTLWRRKPVRWAQQRKEARRLASRLVSPVKVLPLGPYVRARLKVAAALNQLLPNSSLGAR